LGRIGIGACIAATLLAIGLHLVFLTQAGGLWRDEAASVQLASARHFTAEFRQASEYFPVLFFLAERAWWAMGGGESDFAWRILGFLVGLGLLGGIWLNARLMGFRWPLIALGLLAVNLTVVRWGDSLRAYGCGSLLIMVTLSLVWRLLLAPGFASFVTAALGAILSVQTLYHNSGLVLAACIAGWAVCIPHRQWKTAALVLGVGVLAAVSLLPYVPLLAGAQQHMSLQKAGMDLERVWTTLGVALGSGLGWPVVGWVALAAVALGIGWTALGGRPKEAAVGPEDLPLFAVTALVAGGACFFGFMRLSAFPAQPWYYLPIMLFAAGAMDGVLAGWCAQCRAFPLLFLAAMVCLPFPAVWRSAHARQTNVDLVAAQLQQHAKPGDLILVSPYFFGITFDRYYKGSVAWTTLPPIRDQRFHRFDLLGEALCSKALLDNVLSRMANTLASGHELWLVGDWPPPQPGEAAPPELPDAPPPGQHLDFDESSFCTFVWERQAAFLVGTRAQHAARVPVQPATPISEVEDARLIRVRGWR
jgi:hypothetical protein